MRIVAFSDVYALDAAVTDESGIRQTWTDGVLFRMDHPRPINGILYLNGCTGEYAAPDGTKFFAPQKSVVCLPAGSRYTVKNLTSGAAFPDAYLVSFNLREGEERLSFGTKPFLIGDSDPILVPSLIRAAVEAYESPLPSPLAVRGAICLLISELGKAKNEDFQKRFSAIRPGIQILENDPLSTLTLDEIATLCGVSSGCFRKLFHRYAGKSPIRYRIERKIELFKEMLERSDCSVEEACVRLGYENPAYLFRLFHSETGMTPGEYRRLYRGAKEESREER